MRFNIPSKTLQTHLMIVSKVVNSKNSISILDNFLFELQDGKLIITGSDQETTLTTRIDVMETEGEGKFAVNVKNILELLKELPDQALNFEINDSTFEINIFYMNGKYNFMGINGNEFPQKAQFEDNLINLNLPSEEILKGIERTIFAVGTDDLRAIMMGILWDIRPEEMIFVASDTHKLVRYQNKIVKPGIEASFIVPTKPAAILRSILKRDDSSVSIVADAASATFEMENYTLNCRFVKGKYPNYNSVIPNNNPYALTVNRLSFLAAIKRVSVSANIGGLVRFELNDKEVLLRAQDIDFSTSAEETLPCEYNGEEMTIGFKNTCIIEVLNNIEDESIILKLSDPSRAGIFLPTVQKEGEELLVLLMPMKI